MLVTPHYIVVKSLRESLDQCDILWMPVDRFMYERRTELDPCREYVAAMKKPRKLCDQLCLMQLTLREKSAHEVVKAVDPRNLFIYSHMDCNCS